jgi:hypothetical protein
VTKRRQVAARQIKNPKLETFFFPPSGNTAPAKNNFPMNDWNLQSRAHACEACTKNFADREAYHTVLTDERSDFRRMDVCAACWQAQFSADASARTGFISHWQGLYEAPPAAPVDAIQKDTAETLLRKLIEQNDPRHIPAGFILAVMLERKRILKVKEQFQRDGHRVFIYEQPKTGDIFTITDPNLRLDQLQQVQHDVAQLLEHGLNPPGENIAAPAEAVAETKVETETAVPA